MKFEIIEENIEIENIKQKEQNYIDKYKDTLLNIRPAYKSK